MIPTAFNDLLRISAIKAHVILMTGEKTLVYKGLEPVFFNIISYKGISDNEKESHRVTPLYRILRHGSRVRV